MSENLITDEIRPYIKAFTEKKENVNSSFSIKNINSTVYISITPPSGHGRKLKPEHIIASLKRKGYLPKPHKEEIDKIVDIALKLNVCVHNYPIEMQLSENGLTEEEEKEFDVIVTPDKMQASIKINTKEPVKYKINDFLKLLKDSGIIHGVNLDILKKLCDFIETKPLEKTILVATGTNQSSAIDAAFKLNPFFKQVSDTEYRTKLVTRDTKLALKKLPQKCKAETNVYGYETEVPEEFTKFKDFIVKPGFGISVTTEDNIEYYKSAVKGIAVFTNYHDLYMIEAIDAEYSLSVSHDNQALLFDAILGKNRIANFNFEQVLFEIRQMGIPDEILKVDVLKSAIKKLNAGLASYYSSLIIAEGKKPVHGEDGKIDFKVYFAGERKVHYREDGSIDHKLTTTIHSVRPGDVIAEITPPGKGKIDGLSVFGEVIPAQTGKWPDYRTLQGVSHTKDKLQLIATMEGIVRYDKPNLKVEPVLYVQGDVDYETGSIHFKGNLVLKGSILDGFDVYCAGDVIVGENIGACKVVAEGNIEIAGGIKGKGKAQIFACGNITTGYIEQARVEARGNITVRRNVALSRVYSALSIVLPSKGRVTSVAGSRLMAQNFIDVAEIGVESGRSETELIMGFDYDLVRTNKRIQKRLVKVFKEIGSLNKQKEELLKKQPVNEEEILNIEEKLNEILAVYDELLVFQNDVLRRMETPVESAMICRKAIYPISTIVFQGATKKVTEKSPPIVMRKDLNSNSVITEKFQPRRQYY